MKRGFTRPFSPKGKASALPSLPWVFAADQVMIHFKSDPDVIKSYLPFPIKPNPDRDGEAFLWTPNLKCYPQNEEEMSNIKNPARTQYNVCVIAVPGLFDDKEILISAFQWCDKDWLVILSWMIGTCAKQATFLDNGVHPLFADVNHNQTGALGTEFTRTVSRNGEQLINISYTPEMNITSEEMKFFTSTFPLLSERHIPDFNLPPRGKPLVHDLTQMILEKSSAKGFVKGKASLKFNADADNEELGDLMPTHVLGGYRWQTSWVMPGLKVVHDYNSN